MEESLRANIAALTETFVAATGLATSTVLMRAANDARFLDRTANGRSSFTIRVYDNAVRWFSDNWPAGVAWPKGVVRPKPGDPASRPHATEPAA